jgi:hypothetical protein
MSTTAVQPIATTKTDASSSVTTGKRGVRRPKIGTESTEPGCRFFLAGPDRTGKNPGLGQEIFTEGEAMVEAFKSGVTYFALTEWRPKVDFSGKTPQVRKEAVAHKRE